MQQSLLTSELDFRWFFCEICSFIAEIQAYFFNFLIDRQKNQERDEFYFGYRIIEFLKSERENILSFS